MTKYNPLYNLSNSVINYLEEIAKMEGELLSIPHALNQSVSIQTLANIDAVHYSTKLEGNKLTIKEVTQALQGGKSKIKTTRDLKEIINYSKARKLLDETALKNKKLDSNLILQVHDILMQGIVVGKLKGHYRKAQNIIKDASTGERVYMPPEFKDVPALMHDLIIWTEKSLAEKTSTLIVAATFHYRFVTIHPFMDGNGRVARLVTNYILLRTNYTVGRYASIEKQHEQDRKNYYLELKKLQAHNFYDISDSINITTWIEYWLTRMHKTYKEALNRSRKIEPNDTDTMFMEPRLQKAVSLFRKHKKLKASEYGLIMGVGRTQAVEDLNTLVEAGIIFKIGGGRSSVYQIKESKK